MEAPLFPRAFAVDFEDLLRWNVSFFKVGLWNWPVETIRPLSDFAGLESVPISAAQAQAQGLSIIAKINFGGELFLRPDEDYRKYKGALFLVQPERFIFSKINARQGCIFHADAQQKPFVVSSEYPVLRLDAELALGDYVDLALRVGPAREQLQGGAVGMAKPRTSAEDFLRIQIPLPPLWVQREIVARHQKVEADARLNREQLAALEVEAELEFLAALGLIKPLQLAMERCFAVEWKDLERWGVRAMHALLNVNFDQSRYPIVTGRDCLAEVKHGSSASPAAKPTKLEVLKISAVTRGFLDAREKKFAVDKAAVRREYNLREGDVLMCRTNGTLNYVGMSALIERDLENLIFPDKLIRLRAQPNLLPEFGWKALQSPPLRSQIEAAARTAVGNYAIGNEDIWDLRIPLPPLPVQRALIARVRAGRETIKRLRAAGQAHAAQGRAEIEALILGEQKL